MRFFWGGGKKLVFFVDDVDDFYGEGGQNLTFCVDVIKIPLTKTCFLPCSTKYF